MTVENKGLAVGGPADGKRLSSRLKQINIPVKVGPDLGEGNRGFVPAAYVFEDGKWVCKSCPVASDI
jgi:hypothetical protein